jgi:hypothetical protein
MAEDDGKGRTQWLINGCFVELNIPIAIVVMGVDVNLMPHPPMGSAKRWAPDILKKVSLMRRGWMG